MRISILTNIWKISVMQNKNEIIHRRTVSANLFRAQDIGIHGVFFVMPPFTRPYIEQILKEMEQ